MGKSLAKSIFLMASALLLASCGKSGSKDPAKEANTFLYKSGVQKYEVGDYDSALTYFEKALALNPDHAEALLNLGVLYEDYKKDIPKAIEAYQQFLTVHPEGEKTEMVKGWVAKLAKNQDLQIDLPKSVASNPGALVQVNSKMLEENKKLKKEVETLKGELKESQKQQESIRTDSDKKITDMNEQLTLAQETVQAVKTEMQTGQSEQQRNDSKVVTELQAKLKQTEVRWGEEKKEHLKQVQLLENQLREQQLLIEQSSKGEKEVLLTVSTLKRQKEEVETERNRLNEAFNTATQERARLNQLIQEREETIRALKGQLAKGTQQKTFEDSQRQAYERQIALLKQKVMMLEQDRKKYVQLLRTQVHENAEIQSSPNPPVVVQEEPMISSTPVRPRTPSRDYELVTYHRVKRGETLMMIAGYSHIYGDRSKWRIIYEANKTNIDDPNVLVPGQILLVPR